MKISLVKNISAHIDEEVVRGIISEYEMILARYRAGDAESALTRAGKFVEHVFRALEYIRTGNTPTEIKSPSALARTLENETKLPESVRLLIPRIAMAMVYDIRSKRGAVHVKEIDPREIDVSLSVKAASWILAEFIRLYHVEDEHDIKVAMTALMSVDIPFIESLGGEEVVTRMVPPMIEMLILLARNAPVGLTRTELGKLAKCRSQRVTDALRELDDLRFVHKAADGAFHITGPGELHLTQFLADPPDAISQTAVRRPRSAPGRKGRK